MAEIYSRFYRESFLAGQRTNGFASKTAMAPKRKTEANAEESNGEASKKQANANTKVEKKVQQDRIRTLVEGDVKKGPVVYW